MYQNETPNNPSPRSHTAIATNPRKQQIEMLASEFIAPATNQVRSPYYREVHSILKNLDVSLSSSANSDSDIIMSETSRKQRRILSEAKSDQRESLGDLNREIEAEISKADEKSKLICQENPGFRVKVKESEIPLEILYNKDVNAQKMIEKLFGSQNRPITFDIWKDYKGSEGENFAKISLVGGQRENFEI